MGEWGLALTILALVITALGSAVGVAVVHGTQKEKVRALEDRAEKAEERLADAERRLGKGDTQFAITTQAMKGIEDKLDAIMMLLTSSKRRPSKDDDNEH